MSNYITWNYNWPNLPKEREYETDREYPMSPNDEECEDFPTKFLVKSMRGNASYWDHGPRKEADRSRREFSGVWTRIGCS